MNKKLNDKINEKFDYGFDYDQISDKIVGKPKSSKQIVKRSLIATFTTLAACGLVCAIVLPLTLGKGGTMNTISEDVGDTMTEKVDFSRIALNEVKRPLNSSSQDLSEDYLSSLYSFSKDLMGIQDIEKESVIFSPVSIETCFAMLMEGAGGNSKAELMNGFHISNLETFREETKKMILNTSKNTENGTVSSINQSLWVDDSFKDYIRNEYVSCLTDDYYAEAFRGTLYSDEMHKALADYINEKTYNFLDVDKEDFKEDGGVLWLLNTVYMKSSWTDRFYEQADITADFRNIDGTNTEKTFMRYTTNTVFYSNDDVSVVTKSLRDGYGVIFLLPNDETKEKEILADPGTMNYLFTPDKTLNWSYAEVSIQLPEFKVMQKQNLTDELKELGILDVFDRDNADLSGIADLTQLQNNLYVSNATHDAGIEFTHTGVEAAAYTKVDVSLGTAKPEMKIDFIMNRPFMYCVMDSKGTPLFVGTQSIMD